MGQSTLNLVLHEMLFCFLLTHFQILIHMHSLSLLLLHYTLQVVLKMSQLRLNLSTVTKVTEAEKGTFFLVIFCCCYFVFFHAHLNIVIILNIYCLLPAGISSQRPCKGQGSREQMQRRVIKSSLIHCMPPVLFFMRHLMLSWNAIHARSRAYSTPSCLFTIKI